MLSTKRITDRWFQKMTVVSCPNMYGYHGQNVHVRIVFWGFGFYKDDPTIEYCRFVMQQHGYKDIHVITAECNTCAKMSKRLVPATV